MSCHRNAANRGRPPRADHDADAGAGEDREGGLPSHETRREPPEGDRVEVASIRRDPAAYKKFSRGCPDGAETDHAHRLVFALNRLSHLLQRSPPAFSRPLTGRRVDLRRSRLRT